MFTTEGAAVVLAADKTTVVRQHKSEAEAVRLCRLLNGAAELHQQGAKFEADENGKLVFLKKKSFSFPGDLPVEPEAFSPKKAKAKKKAKAAA